MFISYLTDLNFRSSVECRYLNVLTQQLFIIHTALQAISKIIFMEHMAFHNATFSHLPLFFNASLPLQSFCLLLLSIYRMFCILKTTTSIYFVHQILTCHLIKLCFQILIFHTSSFRGKLIFAIKLFLQHTNIEFLLILGREKICKVLILYSLCSANKNIMQATYVI